MYQSLGGGKGARWEEEGEGGRSLPVSHIGQPIGSLAFTDFPTVLPRRANGGEPSEAVRGVCLCRRREEKIYIYISVSDGEAPPRSWLLVGRRNRAAFRRREDQPIRASLDSAAIKAANPEPSPRLSIKFLFLGGGGIWRRGGSRRGVLSPVVPSSLARLRGYRGGWGGGRPDVDQCHSPPPPPPSSSEPVTGHILTSSLR